VEVDAVEREAQVKVIYETGEPSIVIKAGELLDLTSRPQNGPITIEVSPMADEKIHVRRLAFVRVQHQSKE
jgi:hypothetical protein